MSLRLKDTATCNISGNSGTTTKLATIRSINGTNFDGTANITTSNWGTSRTITIGSTGKSVNGSANISWTLSEIGAAASSHTHSYLPLSGGTLTGALTFSNYSSKLTIGETLSMKNSKNQVQDVIRCYDDGDTDANGSELVIQAGGNVYIGSGESASSLKSAVGTNTGETMKISSDTGIEFYTNCQTIANRVGVILTTTRQFYPNANNSGTLGTSTNKWNNVYATTFTGNLSGNASTASKLGTATVGSASKPIYLNAGTATACSSTVGSATVPVYMNAGTVTACTAGSVFSNLSNSGNNISITVAGQNRVLTPAYATNSGTSTKVSATATAGSTLELVRSTMATNDYFRILVGGASNAGYAEIATADDGNEPIYVRQYTGTFATLTRTLTLLDGSGNSQFPGKITSGMYEGYLNWGGRNFDGDMSPVDAAMYEEFNANRLAFIKAAGIKVEYSTNSGSSWTDYGLSDSAKVSLVSTSNTIYPGKTSGKGTSAMKLRVTITASSGGFYFRLRKIAIYLSTNGVSGSNVTIEYSNKGSESTFKTYISNQTVSGWSGWNIINMSGAGFGGGDTQTSNWGVVRMTFGLTSNTSRSNLQIYKIRMFGDTMWSSPSNLASTGHVYSYDASQNCTFPGDITCKGASYSSLINRIKSLEDQLSGVSAALTSLEAAVK